MTLKQLLELLAKSTADLDTLQVKAFGAEGTESDITALQAKVKEVEELERKVKLAKATEDAIARNARPADGQAERGTEPQAKNAPKDATEKLALACQALMVAKAEYGSTSPRNVLKAMNDLGYGKAADDFGQINKANSTLTGAAGGFLIAENFDRSFIDLLYAESSFMEGNPRRIPMPEGNYRQAGGNTGATATYRGEGSDIAVSQPTFRGINMSAHLLSNIVPVTNQLLRYSLGEAGSFIRADGAQAMSLKMDEAAYFGSGIGDVPLGIMNAPGIVKVAVPTALGATPDVRAIETQAKRLLGSMSRFPALRANAQWRVSPRTWLYLTMLRGADDQLLYPTIDGNGTWMGYPIRKAGLFPENLGTGTDETYIALISFGHVLLGESKGLAIDISSDASYKDGNGVMQSAFSTDSTLFRFTMEHDFDVRYAQAVQVLTGVRF